MLHRRPQNLHRASDLSLKSQPSPDFLSRLKPDSLQTHRFNFWLTFYNSIRAAAVPLSPRFSLSQTHDTTLSLRSVAPGGRLPPQPQNAHSRDVVTWNSILAGLVRDGQVGDAETVFGEMPERDVISWSIMITGYVQNGQLQEGLECFKEMREVGLRPNEATLVTMLSASAQMGFPRYSPSGHIFEMWMH